MINITPERAAKRLQRLDNLEYASDFYKEVFGVRPWSIHGRRPSWPKDHLRAHRTASRHFQKLKSTPEGRAQLRADGWLV
jgi:hypothetical protein